MTFDREIDFEHALIEKLTRCGWSPDILTNKTESDLIKNWAGILYHNNRGVDRLGDYPLTAGEMNQIIEQVNACRTPVKTNTFINGKTVAIKRDNPDDKAHFGKEVSLKLYDRKEIAGGSSCYQIAEQPVFNTSNPLASDRRGDIMLLINGMPVIHVELKKSGVPVSQACNQIKKYSHEGVFSQGIFSLVQVFVAMNPDETLYFANPGPNGHFSPEFFFHWADWNNEPVNRWADVTEKLLSIPMAHELIGFYTIADNSDNTLKVMRSYQYFATKAIVDQAARIQWDSPAVRGGYIFHTTGSGKTLTSFKAAQIIAESLFADKVVFLMDRIDLGTQSLKHYRNYAGDLIDINATENTDILVGKLKSDDRNDALIVTSHQKMCRIGDDIKTREKDIQKINAKHIILIVDEAHRDVFGDMFSTIKETFPNAVRFGFTGTPIIDVNRINNSTTKDVFGDELHRYSIADGIRDRNVLGFQTIPVLIYPPKKLRKQVALEKSGAKTYEEAMGDPAKKAIFLKFDRLPMAYTIDENGRRHGGIEDYLPKTQYANDRYYKKVVQDIKDSWETLSCCSMFHAIFATSSIPEAINYYSLLRKKFPELKVTAIFDPSVDNNGSGEYKEDAIIRILDDYNTMFNKKFTVPTYHSFKEDVILRLAHKEPYVGIDKDRSKQINMVIVVDQLLTGFDSKWINTLYMDKVQENENIIQSFSRTNRLFNNLDKPFGTIKYYRYPYTMKKNIEEAVKNYSGNKAFDIFVSKLEGQLNGMNLKYDEIKALYVSAGIPDYSRLPDDVVDKKKFSELFKSFSEYLAAAKIQDFTWKKKVYKFKDENGKLLNTISCHLDEETYHVLLQRYKELSRDRDPKGNKDTPYDIDANIMEIDSLTIDTDYMNSRFTKYLRAISDGADNETVANFLEDLHRSFAMLTQEEQKQANILLGDILSGNLVVEDGKTFRDYITEYIVKSQNDAVHQFAGYFGMDEGLLREIIRDKSSSSDINAFGRFDLLKKSVDRQKAKEYLESVIGEPVPAYKVMSKVDARIREFIAGE